MTSIALDIPVIETDRATLRGLRESDVPAVAGFYAGPRSEWVGGPQSEEDCWRIVASWLGHWVMRGYGLWAIEHKDTHQMAGITGFIFRAGWDEPELAWHIYDGFEGMGLAFEAASAARAYGAAQYDLPSPISYIAAANTRSLALAKRLGAAFERETELLGLPCQIHRHPTHTCPKEDPQ